MTAPRLLVIPESEERKKMGLLPLGVLLSQPGLKPVVNHHPAGSLLAFTAAE